MMSRHVFHNDTLAASTSREKVRDGKTKTENEEEEFSRPSWLPHARISFSAKTCLLPTQRDK